MRRKLRSFLKDQSGAGGIEYAFVVVGIVLATWTAVILVGESTVTFYEAFEGLFD